MSSTSVNTLKVRQSQMSLDLPQEERGKLDWEGVEYPYGPPDDIVIVDEVPLDWNTMPYDNFELQEYTGEIAKKLAHNMVAYHFADESLKKYLPAHNAWLERSTADLEEQVEAMFPGRWELTIQPTIMDNVELANSLRNCEGRVDKYRYESALGDNYCNLIIHFPLLTIRNAKGESWVIKDYYVLLDFNYRMGLNAIKGFRATKSPIEFKLQYTFSHSQKSNSSLVGFCFGSTPLDELVAELKLDAYDPIRLSLLFQQLEDYLSWESIDGGPHCSISKLLHPETTSSAPSISTTQFQLILDQVLYNCDKFATTIDVGGQVHIPTSRELIEVVTQYTPQNLRFPRNEVTGLSIYSNTVSIVDIEQVNKEVARGYQFKFKGKPVHLVVESDNALNEEETKKVEKVADSRIIDQVRLKAATIINNYVYDRFWGNKKGRV